VKIPLEAIKNQPAFGAAGNSERKRVRKEAGKIIKFEEGEEKSNIEKRNTKEIKKFFSNNFSSFHAYCWEYAGDRGAVW
jgi:hypothetical protein